MTTAVYLSRDMLDQLNTGLPARVATDTGTVVVHPPEKKEQETDVRLQHKPLSDIQAFTAAVQNMETIKRHLSGVTTTGNN